MAMVVEQAMVWSDKFLTHVSEIDDQHRVLVQLINDAQNKLGVHPDGKLLEVITRDLLSYAIYHFETEAELMQEYGYQEAASEEHNNQHRAFSTSVVQVRENLKIGKLIASEDLLAFLTSWLADHIMRTDQALAAFIVAKRAAVSAE
jgi:hemerythrin-like metal-binding protein